MTIITGKAITFSEPYKYDNSLDVSDLGVSVYRAPPNPLIQKHESPWKLPVLQVNACSTLNGYPQPLHKIDFIVYKLMIYTCTFPRLIIA